MVEKTSRRHLAIQPPRPYVGTQVTDTGDYRYDRQQCEERKPKARREEMMNNEAGECQPHQPGQQLALKVPVVDHRNKQRELHQDRKKLGQLTPSLGGRPRSGWLSHGENGYIVSSFTRIRFS
jgi:hypothetical protein